MGEDNGMVLGDCSYVNLNCVLRTRQGTSSLSLSRNCDMAADNGAAAYLRQPSLPTHPRKVSSQAILIIASHSFMPGAEYQDASQKKTHQACPGVASSSCTRSLAASQRSNAAGLGTASERSVQVRVSDDVLGELAAGPFGDQDAWAFSSDVTKGNYSQVKVIDTGSEGALFFSSHVAAHVGKANVVLSSVERRLAGGFAWDSTPATADLAEQMCRLMFAGRAVPSAGCSEYGDHDWVNCDGNGGGRAVHEWTGAAAQAQKVINHPTDLA